MAEHLLANATSGVLFMVHKLRYMFYLPNPYETMFPDLNVPRYATDMIPALIFIAVVENLVRLLKGKPVARFSDTVASLACGIFQDCFRLNVRSVELVCYVLVFERYRLTTLPWDSLSTWMLCFILLDWGFYWAHRIAHEVHIIWTVHQAHHSNEDFTALAALRQAFLQPLTAWMTYTPLAIIGIPPQVFLVHMQLTELYMIWIHTEVVKSLGPLEWILNCPSHHRVHHGRNRKYIDKNYAGALIIWDRLFGTFEDEDPDDPVVYGLVHPVESYNIFYLQFHSWVHMFRTMYHTEGWRDKLRIPFKGPGWSPGKPRLGYIDEIPELQHPVTYWEPPTSVLQKMYVVWHFLVIVVFFHQLQVLQIASQVSHWSLLLSVGCILLSLTSIGFILENRRFALSFELLRCLVFFLMEQHLMPTGLTHVPTQHQHLVVLTVRLTFLSSALICAICEFHRLSVKAFDWLKCELKQKLL